MSISRQIVVPELIQTRALNVKVTLDCVAAENRHIDEFERELMEVRHWLDKIISAVELARLEAKQPT